MLKAGEELAFGNVPLADELAVVAGETRAGTPRREALAHFSDRTGIDDVRALVAVIVQTDRYGTNVAQAVRIHADQFRTRRRQRGGGARGAREPSAPPSSSSSASSSGPSSTASDRNELPVGDGFQAVPHVPV